MHVKMGHHLAGPRLQVTFSANDGQQGDRRMELSFVCTCMDSEGREQLKVTEAKLAEKFGTEPVMVDVERPEVLLSELLECLKDQDHV